MVHFYRLTLTLLTVTMWCAMSARAITPLLQQASFVPVCTGANDTTAITKVLVTIGTTPGKIQLPYKNPCKVGNLTIPANVIIDFTNGGSFSGIDSTTLVYNGGIQAEPGQKIFDNYTAGHAAVALGPGHWTRIYANWWGAIPDDGLDDLPAEQAAVDALPSTGGSVAHAIVSTNGYTWNKPLIISRAKITIEGADTDRISTVVESGFFGGPLVFITPNVAFPTVAQLATGTGSAYAIGSPNAINLSDAGAMEMNGLSAFTAECYIKFNALVAGDEYFILSSRGRALYSDSQLGAFELAVDTTGGAGTEKIIGKLRVGATYFTVTGSTIVTTGTTYHIAMSFDGSNIRLFVNGVLQATTAASGITTQRATEDVRIGRPSMIWPDTPDFEPAANAVIDSPRISQVARYTAAFTPPTAKFTNDTNTLALCNFDEQLTQMTKCYTKLGNAYMAQRVNGGLPFISEINIKNVRLNGKFHSSGVFNFSSFNSAIQNVNMEFVRVGLFNYSSSFLTHISDLQVLGTEPSGVNRRSRFLVGQGLSSGVNYYEHLALSGGPVQFLSAGGGLTGTNIWVAMGATDSVFGMLFSAADNATININTGIVSDEAGSGTDTRAAIALSNVPVASFIGGDLQVQLNNVPQVIVDTAQQPYPAAVTFYGTQFEPHVSATEIIHIQGTNPASVLLTGAYVARAVPPPWSLNPVSLRVVNPGEHLPIRIVTTTYAIKFIDHTLRADATGGAFSVTLPTATNVAGKVFVFKKIDASANVVTVATTSSQTIDGSTTYSLATQNKYVTVQSDGTNWIVIGNN